MEPEQPGLVDYLLVPLRWLERSKGWGRRCLLLLYLTIFTAVILLGYRELHLWRLPDLREPFDIEKYGTVILSDANNALPLYEQAIDLLRPAPVNLTQAPRKAWDFVDWTKLDPPIQQWVVESRPVLEVWLKATERPDLVLIQPRDRKLSTLGNLPDSIFGLSKLAMFEASRRVNQGDLEGAWVLYRAVLRSSRHIGRHGNVSQRIIGQSIVRLVRAPIRAWVELPATTPALLRRAIRDIEACKAMTPPNSEMVQVEYFEARGMLSQPEMWTKWDTNGSEGATNWYTQIPWIARSRHFLKREPERSQRVLRLVTAGILAQCDRPRWARPKLYSERFMIYDIDARTPPVVASISPASLAGWAEASGYNLIAFANLSYVMNILEAEKSDLDNLLLLMAERAYQLDHGQPAQTYGDLIGEYLSELPDGIESNDPLGAPTPPK